MAESWAEDSEVVVTDDGNGMTRTGAQEAYLIVGRKRRETPLKDLSEKKKRKVHGRKDIGKLAAFGTAGTLECTTVREGETTAFILDYDEIRKLTPDTDYPAPSVLAPAPLVDPKGNTLSSGTRIRLTNLRVKRRLNEDTFMRSMSRRFAIRDMNVWINGTPLQRFDIPLEFRFPRDGTPPDVDLALESDGWAAETIADGNEVRWWIGFTEKPLTVGDDQGISILARDKMAQRPFKFERAQGTTAQLGQEYLVGEVLADWLDSGEGIETDLIQSNRDQLQLEDPRIDKLLEWGRKRLGWALRERQKLKSAKAAKDAEKNLALEELLGDRTKGERQALLNVAGRIAKLPEMDADGVAEVMRGVIDSQSEVVVRDLMEQIAEEEDPVQDRMWALVAQFGLIDARRLMSVIEARLKTIDQLQHSLAHGAKEVPEIHRIIRADTWLLDPRWHLLGDEVDIDSLAGVQFQPETDEETGNHLDFLFALAPMAPALVDEVVVVEIKRGTHPNGRVRRADVDEVNKFHGYVVAVQEHYAKNTNPPTVRGLMVAEGYSAQGDRIRRSLEQIGDPKLEFKTWERVLDETERMHMGWLAVNRKRSKGSTASD